MSFVQSVGVVATMLSTKGTVVKAVHRIEFGVVKVFVVHGWPGKPKASQVGGEGQRSTVPSGKGLSL